VSWVLAFLGFAALVILHEAGHFAAAKAVGMRVERFSLFFPPLLGRIKRGETEYAIGAIPLGGYVKITGMNPAEEIPPEAAHRAYYRQPPWKRIVVIAAGPAVNILIAFLLLWGLYMVEGTVGPPAKVGAIEKGTPAAKILKPGDAVTGVDGRRISGDDLDAQAAAVSEAITRHKGGPLTLQVTRDGRPLSLTTTTFYDPKTKRHRVGFSFGDGTHRDAGPIRAAGLGVSEMWSVTSTTVSHIVQIFVPKERKQLSSVVGGYKTTQKAFTISTAAALEILALISLSLGIINLFPFLPLDGGHIFWAVAEKLRGRAIPFSVMERAGFIGFALVIGLFMIGLTNDIDRIANGGFGIR
jgi:regulator of sigma E protease